ncbi:alpha/beta fold hydrolase [Flavobacterium dauae]|uniref:alpha/beta fold hydrolase n=1 Tax=Flavobacterium dauae TaxID=1563479 RepID=UPI00272DE878|nr:alpha/beta fold hydrolase [Flavobacterium dauae]WLD24755.1 alpha/beta fold hydrolase [Flavobacterium dauae]
MYKLTSFLILFITISLSVKAQKSLTVANYVLTNDSIKLYTKKAGNGPIAIFIHGGPGAWSKSFEDLGGSNLESRLTMIYYDQRGCGRSEGSKNDDYSLEKMLEDIEMIRQRYNANKVYLIAHSFGGILAVNYAQKYPDHIKGLIFVNSTLNLFYSIQHQINYMNSLLKTDYKAVDTSQIIPTFKNVQSKFVEEGFIYKLLSDNKNNADLLNKIDSENPSEFAFAQKALYIADYQKDYTKITHQIKVPVLVISGTKDHAIGEDHFKSFNFPNQTIKEINGGHLLYYEKNKKFINTVFEFVRK